MAACVHALSCVGSAAGHEMFRTVAGDATSVLLVNVLARDVLLEQSVAAVSGHHDGAGLEAIELQRMYFCPSFLFLIFLKSHSKTPFS
jgi:hypothetical protein